MNEIKTVPIDDLHYYDRNPRRGDIEILKESLTHHGQYKPVLVQKSTNKILAGNHTVKAANALGWDTVKVIYTDVNDVTAKKIVLMDNRSSDISGYDMEELIGLLQEIDEAEGGTTGTGYTKPDLDILLNDLAGMDVSAIVGPQYTGKIDSPIYEPSSSVPPPVPELYDTTRTKALLAEINQVDLPANVRSFLRAAAQRHTSFHYEKIAEYYAHAPEEVQKLMEASALVIIDFDQALERGFVKLHQTVDKIFHEEYPDA